MDGPETEKHLGVPQNFRHFYYLPAFPSWFWRTDVFRTKCLICCNFNIFKCLICCKDILLEWFKTNLKNYMFQHQNLVNRIFQFFPPDRENMAILLCCITQLHVFTLGVLFIATMGKVKNKALRYLSFLLLLISYM